ncbi:hypothetical protein LTS18_007428 [Coniosporium uncinatum]|uniref:Uncharacterized protein n=1 Tax=Coniosporium uncinatum TaxID=93489 RepID=A0ACC3D2L0_9PEZI|nr:hypothetical protein LTS18_007428 [Coniosporium uncinatum]
MPLVHTFVVGGWEDRASVVGSECVRAAAGNEAWVGQMGDDVRGAETRWKAALLENLSRIAGRSVAPGAIFDEAVFAAWYGVYVIVKSPDWGITSEEFDAYDHAMSLAEEQRSETGVSTGWPEGLEGWVLRSFREIARYGDERDEPAPLIKKVLAFASACNTFKAIDWDAMPSALSYNSVHKTERETEEWIREDMIGILRDETGTEERIKEAHERLAADRASPEPLYPSSRLSARQKSRESSRRNSQESIVSSLKGTSQEEQDRWSTEATDSRSAKHVA